MPSFAVGNRRRPGAQNQPSVLEEERRRRGSGGDYGTRVGSCGAGRRGLEAVEKAPKGVME